MKDEARWDARELRGALDRYEAELRAAGLSRNTVNTYVQHPQRFINWLEGRYRPRRSDLNWEPDGDLEDASHSRIPPASLPDEGPSYTPAPPPRANGWPASRGSSRYDPLRAYLAARPEPVVRLSFAEIEGLINGRLPDSARRHRPWWANERSGSHVHASAWMGAGRRTANVDINVGTVDFVR
jgi:hypothetical protein